MTAGFRVYGPSLGNASNARVAAGMCAGLSSFEAFRGFVPIDTFDDEESYEGADADDAIFVGPFTQVGIMRQGDHRRRFCLVQPNSSWLPDEMVQIVGAHALPVVPSLWAKTVSDSYFSDPALVWEHGVDNGFGPDLDVHNESKWSAESGVGQWTVLHLSSSTFERKGTIELVQAWMSLKRELPRRAKLLLVVQRTVQDAIVEMLRGHPEVESSVCFRSQLSGSVEEMRRLYLSANVVCQPSRGEAFGMVPLEALCCGVPVVVTSCTGHSQYCPTHGGPGMVVIPTGDDEPIDDGPGAVAPSLAVSDVANSLVEAYERRYELGQSAYSWAKQRANQTVHGIAAARSWEMTTWKWLADIGYWSAT